MPNKNTGVLIGPEYIRPTDFVAGAETGIAYEARNPSGDWEKYKPTDEWQRYFLNGIIGYDTLSCVTFSALRCVAMQIEWMIDTGKISGTALAFLRDNGYIDENGKVNFNEHYTAVMSGTTTNGNTLTAVWDSIRKDGVLPQKDGPSVNDFTTTAAWLAGPIPQTQIEKARKFLSLYGGPFQVAYEWAVLNQPGAWELFAVHVKQAPLHIATPTCGSWNNPSGTIVTSCGDYKQLNHATSYIGQVKDGASSAAWYHKDLDHYNPFVKRLSWDYYMPYALKGIVSEAVAAPTTPAPSGEFTTALKLGDTGPEVVRLQQALATLTHTTTYMKKGVTGPYGPSTQKAVADFQADHGIADSPAGAHFGPQTMEALNKAIAAKSGGDALPVKAIPSMDSIMQSAAKIVFIVMAVASCAALFVGKIDGGQFLSLTTMAFAFYFGTPSTASQGGVK